MSAPWKCWLCCRGDGSDGSGRRTCDCVLVRHEDWLLLFELWRHTRQSAVGDEAFWPSDEMNERLDALFFAGEECHAVVPFVYVERGEDSCT